MFLESFSLAEEESKDLELFCFSGATYEIQSKLLFRTRGDRGQISANESPRWRIFAIRKTIMTKYSSHKGYDVSNPNCFDSDSRAEWLKKVYPSLKAYLEEIGKRLWVPFCRGEQWKIDVMERELSTWSDILENEIEHEIEVEEEKRSSRLGAITICMADVHPEPIKWLWPGRIALGKLTLIAGDPGLGKSLITSTFAAAVSKGYTWPLTDSVSPMGSVVLLSAEDDPADTIRPRLDAADADCTRIHIIEAIREKDENDDMIKERMFSLEKDIKVLAGLLPTLPDCRLLIIDPISAYLGGTDSYNNSEVRGLLAPLAKLAADYAVAVVLVQHLNKSSGGGAMYRSMGSIAFVAAARAAYVVTKDRENPLRRLVMPVKNNLAKDVTGLAYSVIEAKNGQPVIAWEKDPVTITADEALVPSDSYEEKTHIEWAVEILKLILAEGPKSAAEVKKEATQAGLTDKTLRRAREKLGIKPRKRDFKSGWMWSLPHHEDAQESQDAPSKNEGNLGGNGHLRHTGPETL